MKVGILTVSDRAASGEYDDHSGPLIVDMIKSKTSWDIRKSTVVRDDIEDISETLLSWCDENLNLILTSGGTGFAPRDITPEATRKVIQKEAPGIAEALRYESLKLTRHAMLSRGVAGIRGQTLIINLPGNPKAVKESMDVLLPVLPHALDLLVGAEAAESGHRII